MFSPAEAKEVMDFHRRATPRTLVTTVETLYVRPTSTTGAQFVASDMLTGDTSGTSYDYGLTTEENHLAAAIALISEWRVGDYQLIHYSENHNGSGYVFTFRGI